MTSSLRPVFRRFTLLALMALPTSPTLASGDLFAFSASHGDFHFLLQMTGREDPGVVQVMSSDFKDYMPRRKYHVEFDRSRKRAYIRPRTRDGLPWFEMDVVGDKGILHYDGRRMEGAADWTVW